MREEELLAILTDWNLWTRELNNGIFRDYYVNKILSLLNDTNVVAEIGIRRCGKSFIAIQALTSLLKKGYEKQNTLIINLNDERYFSKDYSLLMDIYAAYKKNLKPEGLQIVVIDEPQEIDGWEKFVRGLSERENVKFIVTGSSSKLLSSEFSTLLSGRHVVVNIMPLSFFEYLKFKGIEIKSNLDIAKNMTDIKANLDEYLTLGGYPAIVLATNKRELLSSYFDTIIVKDIIQRYHIREVNKLRLLTKFYLTNISSPITYNSIEKFTKIPVKTLQRFSEYLESAYILFFVNRFSFSIKAQENSPRKVYAIDNGLTYVAGFNVTIGKGALLENIVAIELKRRNEDFYYWKDAHTNKEVDFVVAKNKDYALIQVSYELNDPNTVERELGSLAKAMKEFNKHTATLITYAEPNETVSKMAEKLKINIIPLWKWLLDTNA